MIKNLLKKIAVFLLIFSIFYSVLPVYAVPNDENYDDNAVEPNITKKEFTRDGIKYTLGTLENWEYVMFYNSNFSLGDGSDDYYIDFGPISSVKIEAEDGSAFRLIGMSIDAMADENVDITPSGGASVQRNSSDNFVNETIDLSSNSDFYNITSVTISGSNMGLCLDDLDFDDPYVPDTTAPEVTSVDAPVDASYIAGDNLDFTVNFSEAVTVVGGTPTIPVTLNTGGTVNASYTSDSGTSALVFRYTVQAGDQDNNGIKVGSEITLNGATIKDGAENEAILALNSIGETDEVLVDGIVPQVSSVSVPADATYIEGENLDFTVNFSEAVTVLGGIPYIPVTIESEGIVNASYVSGSGTNALVFRYTVQAGDQDNNGIKVGSEITLSGAAIKDGTGNHAVLKLSEVGNTEEVKVDAADPEGVDVGVPANGTYGAGQNLDFTVNFSEAVTVAGGTPTIQVTLDTGGVVNADYVSGTGTSSLVFRYTVQAGDQDNNGIEVGSEITLNGATIKDGAENEAILALNSIGETDEVLVDGIVPQVSSVSVPANATYKEGGNLDFTVNFSEAVTVAGGTPTIPVTLNTGGTVNASYTSDSGTSALVFRYTVQAGDQDNNGIKVGSEITLNGATIKDGAENEAILALNSIGETDEVLVDGIVPQVSSVSVPADTTYIEGQNLDFTVNFSEAVTVSGGIPYIPVTLDIGGTVEADYISGTGTNALVFRYTVQAGDQDNDGIEVGSEIKLNGATMKDGTVNDAVLTLREVGNTGSVKVDTENPAISTATLSGNNKYIDIICTEGIYGAPDGSTALTDNELAIVFTQNGGTATNAVISSIKKNDNTIEDLASALTGGETTIRVFLKITGIPVGVETIEIAPADNNSIYDGVGHAMSATETTGAMILNDDVTSPTAGGNGAITIGAATKSTIDLAWAAGTDNQTIQENLWYKVVYSTNNDIDTVTNALSNGTVAQDWTKNITSKQVTGLSSGTTYYFNVIIKDEAGNMTIYKVVSKATISKSSGGSSSGRKSKKTTDTTTSTAEVVVNGQAENIGARTIEKVEDKVITTITIDDKKIEEKLNAEDNNSTVVIPFNNRSDVVVGVLNGRTVKAMETKETVLEIETDNATYTIPASEINIDDVSEQIGNKLALKDIKINIKIAEPPADTVKIVENSANDENYKIVVKPIEFEITCKSGKKTVNVSRFNRYVQRIVEIPSGVDPSKITTGVILNNDGSLSHVPTQVFKKDGKYYAKLKSLTNSVYTVIWNPITVQSVENHWSKVYVNDMAARLVIKNPETFSPDDYITRGDFAEYITKALGLYRAGAAKTVKFNDVKLNHELADAITIATEYGIITGYPDGSFRPNALISREEAMTMYAKAMDVVKFETINNKKISSYRDKDKISSWAYNYVKKTIDGGVFKGRTHETIDPKGTFTYAEAVTAIRSLLIKSELINE